MASARLAAGFRPLRVEPSGSVVTGAEAGSGAPLVLLHGLGGTWEYWGRTIALLSDRARCIALDLPGFGHSDEPAGGFDLDSAADDLAAAMRALDTGAGGRLRPFARRPAGRQARAPPSRTSSRA